MAPAIDEVTDVIATGTDGSDAATALDIVQSGDGWTSISFLMDSPTQSVTFEFTNGVKKVTKVNMELKGIIEATVILQGSLDSEEASAMVCY